MILKKWITAALIFSSLNVCAEARTVSIDCPQTLVFTKENVETRNYNADLPQSLRDNGFVVYSTLAPPAVEGTYIISPAISNSRYSPVQLVANGNNRTVLSIMCWYKGPRGETIIEARMPRLSLPLDSVNVTQHFTTFQEVFRGEPLILKKCSPYEDDDLAKFNETRCRMTWKAP